MKLPWQHSVKAVGDGNVPAAVKRTDKETASLLNASGEAGTLVLSTDNLVKKYRQRIVVNHVSINVHQGEIVGLLGPNGAGKTTTFYMTTGLVTPNEGRVFLNDVDITTLPVYRRAQLGIGYLPQEASVFRTLSVEDNIRTVLEMTDFTPAEQKDRLEQLISEFEELEVHQFDCCNIYNKDRVWGLFGEEDTLAHFEPLFLKHYMNSHHFPGGHTPTAEQFKTWYCPLIEKLLLDYPIAEDRVRYFQHFKGNKYKLIASAFDSETQERMVVYQALYGDRKYWVRPEKMFFEQIERNGKRFSRFQEIDWEE